MTRDERGTDFAAACPRPVAAFLGAFQTVNLLEILVDGERTIAHRARGALLHVPVRRADERAVAAHRVRAFFLTAAGEGKESHTQRAAEEPLSKLLHE